MKETIHTAAPVSVRERLERTTLATRAAMILIAGAAFASLAPVPAAWVERLYSTGTYLLGQQMVTRLSSLVGFALLDLLVAVLAVALAVWWWRSIRRAPHGWRACGAVALRTAFRTLGLAAGIYLVFLTMWGLNYRREPLTAKLDYEPARISPVALSALSSEAVSRLNRLHAGAAAEGDWPAFDELVDWLGPAFDAAQRQLGASPPAVPGRPKPTLFASYFRSAGVDAMVNPWALEVLVNDAVLPYERPFLVAHEWSHLAGYANEAEASFVGLLVCLAGDARSRYSAWLYLTPRLVQYLPRDLQAEVWAGLHDVPRADLRAIATRFARDTTPVVQRSASVVYDRFLRANRVDAGMASYGQVVDLVLGTAGTDTWQ